MKNEFIFTVLCAQLQKKTIYDFYTVGLQLLDIFVEKCLFGLRSAYTFMLDKII